MGVTADVMVRDSQASAGYWEVTRDALADLVRIQLLRRYDEVNYPELYNAVRGLRGDVWLCAFPNLFITIAPAEWKFPRPYFLEPYADCVFAGAYVMALHMFYLVRCIWAFLANRWGCRSFINVFHLNPIVIKYYLLGSCYQYLHLTENCQVHLICVSVVENHSL